MKHHHSSGRASHVASLKRLGVVTTALAFLERWSDFPTRQTHLAKRPSPNGVALGSMQSSKNKNYYRSGTACDVSLRKKESNAFDCCCLPPVLMVLMKKKNCNMQHNTRSSFCVFRVYLFIEAGLGTGPTVLILWVLMRRCCGG